MVGCEGRSIRTLQAVHIQVTGNVTPDRSVERLVAGSQSHRSHDGPSGPPKLTVRGRSMCQFDDHAPLIRGDLSVDTLRGSVEILDANTASAPRSDEGDMAHFPTARSPADVDRIAGLGPCEDEACHLAERCLLYTSPSPRD